jgi:uncharacterized protein YecT (DUF1311 family)
MKRYLSIILLLFSLTLAFGQTQQEMNAQAARGMDKAEAELNTVYRKVLQLYAADTVFIRKLRIAERIWVQFRDAQIEMKYPGNPMDYGTVGEMCIAMYKEYLTRERIKTLKEWVDGEEDGDVCSGSVRILPPKQ